LERSSCECIVSKILNDANNPSLRRRSNERKPPTNITMNYEMVVLCCVTMVFSIARGIFMSFGGFGFYVLVLMHSDAFDSF